MMEQDTNVVVVVLGATKKKVLETAKLMRWNDAEIALSAESASMTLKLSANPLGSQTLLKDVAEVAQRLATEAYWAGEEIHGLTITAHQYDTDGALKALTGNS